MYAVMLTYLLSHFPQKIKPGPYSRSKPTSNEKLFSKQQDHICMLVFKNITYGLQEIKLLCSIHNTRETYRITLLSIIIRVGGIKKICVTLSAIKPNKAQLYETYIFVHNECCPKCSIKLSNATS